MRCLHCGFENDSQAKFCGECGHPLEPAETSDTQPIEPLTYQADPYIEAQGPTMAPSRKKNLVPILALGLAICLGLVAAFFFLSDASPFGKARVYADVLEKGRAAYMDQEYSKALDILALVPEDAGKSYEEASDLKDKVEKGLVKDLEAKFQEGQYKVVQEEAKGYLEALPESQGLKDLAQRADQEVLYLQEEGLKAKEAELNQQIEAAKAAAKKAEAAAAQAKKNPAALKNTYQTVQTTNANVRSGPGLEYPVIYSLDKGDSVYVYETVEAGIRTWCDIGDGWISSRTLTGEL